MTTNRLPRLFLVLLCCIGSLEAVAHGANPPINVDGFRPGVHRGDILNVQGAARDQGAIWQVGSYLTLSNRLLNVLDSHNQRLFGAVNWQLKADVFASVRLFHFLSIGLDVPIIFYTGGDTPFGGADLTHVNDIAIGDLRLSLKATIVGRKTEGFAFAIAEDLTFPNGYPGDSFSGDELPTGTTLLIFDYLKKGWHAAINLGYRLRKEQKIFDEYEARNQIILSGALAAPILCGRLYAVGSLEMRTSGIEPFAHGFENSLDGLFGGQVMVGNLAIQAAGGGGFLHGLGSAGYRGTVSIAYEPRPYRGCLADYDGDTVPDRDDQCPRVPGDPKLGGCPDTDRDGIVDGEDECPLEAGPLALRGCPDMDGDGIIDRDDRCPTIGGNRELAGCPDSDNDGIPDYEDKCPDAPGAEEKQGCPEAKVIVTQKQIFLAEMVFFEFAKADIMPRSFPILREVAKLIITESSIRLVRIEGHTDNVGGAAWNMDLSRRRAESVRRFLIDAGVPAEKLTSAGYGLTRPIADNATPEGRERNRRVSFIIVERIQQ